MTQKDAVFSAITSVLANNNIAFTQNNTNAAELMTRELRAQVNAQLRDLFENGSIELSEEANSKLQDTAALKAYISGLVSNWLRKDTRLNGGSVVATTAPSVSRALREDNQLIALKTLLNTETDTNRRNEIQAHIQRRTSELSK
jgi:hypothetical protein